jgi:acyl-CoA thioesterase FadM
VRRAPSGGGGPGEGRGAAAGGLHAEQHFEYHKPVRAGDVLTAQTRPGRTWEREGRRGGRLRFSESITEYRNQDGDLVVTARGVGVRTERVIEQG